MHDPKFEKEVQQKMEELSFSPSEAVWKNVEKEIKKEKKRRLPFFWFFLLGGITLAGGYYTFVHEQAGKAEQSSRPGQNPQLANAGANDSNAKMNTNSTTGAASMETSNFPGQTETGDDKGSIVTAPGQDAGIAARPAIPSGNALKTAGGKIQYNNAYNHRANRRAKTGSGSGSFAAGEMRQENSSGNESPDGQSESGLSATGQFKPDQPDSGKWVAKHEDAMPPVPESITAAPMPPKQAVTGADSRNKIIPKVHNRLLIGFTGGIGMSAVDESLFRAASVDESSRITTSFAYPPGWQSQPSKIRPGTSFRLGVFAQKQVRRNIAVSIGFTYHYHSTRISTGPEGNHNNYAAASALVYPGISTSTATAAYNTGGNGKYTNQYHLLELPLSFQWRVAGIRKLPVYWEAGVSILRLLGSDALHFDAVTSTYYKNSSLFNNTQVNLSTGFLLGLPFHGRRLMAGPRLEYGLSNLLNNKAAGEQHLLYGGIKLAMTVGKNR